MATMAMGQKDARLDLRMNSEQKETIGRAAAASGMSVSQWALDRLMMSARSDLLDVRAFERCQAATACLLACGREASEFAGLSRLQPPADRLLLRGERLGQRRETLSQICIRNADLQI